MRVGNKRTGELFGYVDLQKRVRSVMRQGRSEGL